MQLTSLGFLFVLLPVGGLIYYFLRGAGRRRFLLGYSLLFVGLLSPLCLLLLLAVMVPDYLLARYIAMAHPRARSILLGCVIKAVLCVVPSVDAVKWTQFWFPTRLRQRKFSRRC